MPKRTRNYRPPFDPGRAFVVSRPLPVNGARLDPGTPFDKTQVTTRRLRQMYEQRLISFAEDGPGAVSYVARRAIRVSGQAMRPGDPVDLSVLKPGRAAQLVSQGLIRCVQSETEEAPGAKPWAIGPADVPRRQRRPVTRMRKRPPAHAVG